MKTLQKVCNITIYEINKKLDNGKLSDKIAAINCGVNLFFFFSYEKLLIFLSI